MEVKNNLAAPLINMAEAYGKTSFELLKLKAIDKTAATTSALFSRLLFVIILSFFVFILNIAVALWLGDLLGKYYYGFLIISAFYALLGIIIFFMHPVIKARVNNWFITQMLN